MIHSISIKNVKGIKDWSFSFTHPEMHPNKVHILIAPNGFGKSSVARAFECMNNRRLNLKDKDCYQNDTDNQGLLSLSCRIDEEDHTLTANQNENQILKKFDSWVIRAPSKVKTSQRPTANGFQIPIGEFVIEDIEICKIPDKAEIPYQFRSIQKEFGELGKLMPNLSSYLKDHETLEALLASKLGEKRLGVTATKKVKLLIGEIEKIKGTVGEITQSIPSIPISNFPELEEVISIFDNIEEKGSRILAAIQILQIHHKNIQTTKKSLSWLRSQFNYSRAKEFLKSINPAPGWLEPEVVRTKGKVVIKLPKPDQMSNGQRDFLSFAANLLKFEIHSTKKRRILIIDEVFDYLDYSNIVTCQYYLKKFIDREKLLGRHIYLWLFTHLDPSVFNSFIFSRKIQKNHFLDRLESIDNNKGICRIIKIRDQHEGLKSIFDVYYAHYSPNDCLEKELFREKGLKESWGCSKTFKNYCEDEARKYIAPSENKMTQEIDYLAVCLHVRISIEERAHSQLTSQQQLEFRQTHKTLNKLDRAQSFGASIPELDYLLAGLMNTALHETNPNTDFVSPIVTKLQNQNIKAMIRDLIG